MLRLVTLTVVSGCSLFVKFNDSDIPIDAAPDAFMPFSADLCAFAEPNDTAALAFTVSPGDTGPAAICPNADGTVTDVDFYKFTVDGTQTSVTVSIAFDQAARGDLDLLLFDANGLMVAESRGFGTTESIACPGASPPCAALAAGDYDIEVLPGVVNDFNQYTVTLAVQ